MPASNQVPASLALRRAVGRDQAGLPNHVRGIGACNAQAGDFEIGPGLLRAVATGRVGVEPVALGKNVRYAGLYFRRKAGKNGKCGSNARRNRDG